MNANLKTTLKAWPAIAAGAIAACWLTGAVASSAFGIELDDQSSVSAVRDTVTWLFKRLCSAEGRKWYFFGDLWALAKIVGAILVFAPVCEEIVFRWLLWRLPRPAEPVVPAVTSSALFAGAHYIFAPWPDKAFIALFLFGLAQCWLYHRTGRLWCAMLNHALFNATNFALIFVIQ